MSRQNNRFGRLIGLVAFLTATGVLGAPTQAQAGYQMTISWTSGGGNSITIMDGGPNDLNPAAGAITYMGTAGNFCMNVDSGFSKPVLGSPSHPDMDLFFCAIKPVGSAADTLTIQLTDTDFTGSPLPLVSQIGGTFSGAFTQVNAQSSYDSGNLPGGAAGGSSTTQHFVSSPFSGTNVLAVGTNNGPYSLTLTVNLVAGAGDGIATGDFQLTAAPAPAGLLLAVSGLPVFGLGAWLRRRGLAARG